MSAFKKNFIFFVVGLVLLALGAGGGWWWSQRSAMAPSPDMSGSMGATKQEESKVLFWYDPMYPQQRFDKPGKSPFMDMQLVPKYADASGEGSGIKIDPTVLQNLGARMAAVSRISLATKIEATGLIGYNERNMAVVQNRTNGFVEHTWPLAPGDMVKAGQPLVQFLVPEWAAAQHELIAIRTSGDAALLAAARDRLRLLGMPEKLIANVEKSGVPQSRYTVTAPIGGLLQSLDVRTGMTVMGGQTLARINGLNTVWLEVAVPQAFASSVRNGGSAQVQIDGFPGEMIEGRITAILPMLSEASRSLRVRVELPNKGGRLRPGLSALVTLGVADEGTALAVPTEAIIRSGKRALVMVGENGRFVPVTVNLGREVGEKTVILSGLSEGQQIVSSGQFLIDSEASLSGIMARKPDAAMVMTETPSLHEADATIKEVGKDEVTLSHGPFKTLSMPGMTMAFPVAKPEVVKGFKAGDKVHVQVRQTDDGLIVEKIEKRGGNP